MPTKLTRPVTRETGYIDHRTRKPYLIRLEAGGLLVSVRVKGSRTWQQVLVKQIVIRAAQNVVDAERAARKERREQRKRERNGQ